MSKLATWGHQGKTHEDLRAALAQIRSERQVTMVADVRRRPTSRRPEWRSKAIHDALLADPYARYWTCEELGNTGKTAKWERPPETGDTEATLATSLAQGNPILLLCYEADAAECHRTEVAAEIMGLVGLDPEEVIHL